MWARELALILTSTLEWSYTADGVEGIKLRGGRSQLRILSAGLVVLMSSQISTNCSTSYNLSSSVEMINERDTTYLTALVLPRRYPRLLSVVITKYRVPPSTSNSKLANFKTFLHLASLVC